MGAGASGRGGAGEALEFGDDAVELVHDGRGARGAKFIYKRAEIPERALFAAFEARPDFIPDGAKVAEYFASVVDFVGGGDQADVGRRFADMPQIIFFALAPGRLGVGKGVAAALDDARDAAAELVADLGETRAASLVFDRVVEEGGDGGVLVTTVFKDDGSDAQEVPDVGTGGAFARLAGVQPRGVGERLAKAGAEHRFGFFPAHLKILRSAF